MTATGNDYLPSGSAFDPMAIAYLEVSNGAETLLLQPSQCSDVDENLSHCQLDSAIVETLIASCEGYFLPVELASLRRFVETHSDSGNVMALVKRRAVVVEQRPQ